MNKETINKIDKILLYNNISRKDVEFIHKSIRDLEDQLERKIKAIEDVLGLINSKKIEVDNYGKYYFNIDEIYNRLIKS